MIEANEIITPAQFPVKELSKRETHGHAKRGRWTPEFRAWHAMKCRCSNPKTTGYKNWGGRGIAVCERWSGRLCFPNFLEDVGLKPTPKHSLDRIDNDGNYSCGKCRQCVESGWTSNVKWSTKLEQDNNRRGSCFLELDGVRMTRANWARKIGITPATLDGRLRNWSLKRSLETPPMRQNRTFKINGLTMTIREMSAKTGFSWTMINWRIKAGWTEDEILSEKRTPEMSLKLARATHIQ